MKINAIDIKPGNVLEYQSKLWLVLKRELVQPGKGGAFAQVELRDLRGGSKLNERFRTQETVERVRLDEKEMQFLFMESRSRSRARRSAIPPIFCATAWSATSCSMKVSHSRSSCRPAW